MVYDLGTYPAVVTVFSASLSSDTKEDFDDRLWNSCELMWSPFQNKISDLLIIGNEFGKHSIIATFICCPTQGSKF